MSEAEKPVRRVDIAAATQAFERARDTHVQAFGQFFLARLLGFDVAYDDETCTVAFDVQDFMFNPQGSLHGGVIVLAMDVSMGHLLARSRGPGATLELKTQFLAPVPVGRAQAVGRALKRGRSTWFLESRFYNASGELAAFATSTWKSAPPPAK